MANSRAQRAQAGGHQSRAEQPKSLKEAFGPASQAEMYLLRALEEFHHSANPPDLWVPVDALHRGSILEAPQAIMNAYNRRLHFLRSAVLFAALTAEAFTNELLDELLSPADFNALDKLPTPDKLLIGTQLACAGKSPLERGAQPLQDLTLLFKTRNRLVHARPQGGIAAWDRDVEEADELAIGPKAALTAILRVAETVNMCTELRAHPILHGGLAKMILHHRGLLERHQDLAGPKILDLPARDAAGVPLLRDQMMEVVAASRASND
jgi:hypothetical protein